MRILSSPITIINVVIAIEKKRLPENVIAKSIILLFLKQFREDIILPKIVTSKKKSIIRMILAIIAFSIKIKL